MYICKWKYDADSPFLFWIDDLTDAWMDTSAYAKIGGYMVGDWGRYRDEQNSAFSFLVNEILSVDPRVKTTFFVPVGPRSPVIRFPIENFYSKRIDENDDMISFLRRLAVDDLFELAYHGTNHGVPGDITDEFIQEWDGFGSLEEALKVIKQGKGIFEGTVGTAVRGGKYCGYREGSFGEKSIDVTGFDWWCRYHNRARVECEDCDYGGTDRNMSSAFDIKRFGKRGVVDIPTTLDGFMFNSAVSSGRGMKGIARRLLKKHIISRGMAKIDHLLQNRLVISVQEHISPARGDIKVQMPNIFTDMSGLALIIEYLADKKVWRCTGSELCDYVNLRDNVKIVETQNGFRMEADYLWIHERVNDKVLSVRDGDACRIVQPDGSVAKGIRGIFNINVMEGDYRVYE